MRVGFVLLGERPGAEIAAGVVGRFWRLADDQRAPVRTHEGFVAFAVPGYAKAAMAFLVRPEAGGTRVIHRAPASSAQP